MTHQPETDPISYGQPVVNYLFKGNDIFVISDLHLAEGKDKDGNYSGSENFFADGSFQRFIHRLMEKRKEGSGMLIINGDMIDYLRIGRVPVTESDFTMWQQALAAIGISKTIAELKKSVNDKEIKYGLKTDDYKSVWKLMLCAGGHAIVFASLAQWLAGGNKLVIVKGNHDLEWYWAAVRNYMDHLMAQNISARATISTAEAMDKYVRPNLSYVDDSFIINNEIHVEHGHRYERFTAVDGPAQLENCDELNLPFGSFFNRYLINRVELSYPYIDNVRPSENILPVLIQERFPLAIKMLFSYLPFTFMVIPKRQYKYALKYLFQFLLLIGLPVALAVLVLWSSIGSSFKIPEFEGIPKVIFTVVKSLSLLILSYFMSRLFAMLQLSSSGGLSEFAAKVFEQNKRLKLVTFGHTHNPQQKSMGGTTQKYYNTGTWMPVFENNAASVRLDKTYTLLYLMLTEAGNLNKSQLIRWNDDALRIDEQVLIERI
nr:metallophosphoesterase [uncultured Mucilaginibacter sp.]